MKFTLEMQKTISDPVADLVLSAPAEFNPGEAEVIIEKAIARAAHFEANGLTLCRHENGALGGFVLTTLDLKPHIMGKYINSKVGAGYYVNTDYYGSEDEPKVIDHGFTEADIGSVFFIAQATDLSQMPGHNPNIPGSICANMRWGKERDEAFAAFCAKFAHVGEGRAVNYLSHSLIYAHDLNRGLYGSTLGRVGFVDYIQQAYDIDKDLCPYGGVDDVGKPEWYAGDAGARADYAAVFLVR